MPFNLKGYKIFIASPSGLEKEREAFAKEIDTYNINEALPRGIFFQTVGWENTLPGMGRPQSLINKDLIQCDFFILILHDKWGSHPGINEKNATSGTEEEFRIALDCYKKEDLPMKQIVCFFKSVSPNQLANPKCQLEKVLEFKKWIENEKILLYTTFLSVNEFCVSLRMNLAKWLRDIESSTEKIITPVTPKIPEDIKSIKLENEELTKAGNEINTESIELIENAWRLTEEGKLTEAEIQLSKALIKEPKEYQLLNYSRFLFETGQLDKSLVMINRAIELSNKSINDKFIAKSYSYKGVVLKIKGDYEGAIGLYEKALVFFQKIDDKQGIANQLGNLAIVYKEKGNLVKAEELLNQSLNINTNLGCDEGVANNLTTLGNILQTKGKFEAAIDLYNRSIEVSKKSNKTVGIASNYANIGIILQVQEKYEEAEKVFYKALSLDKKIGRLEGVANQHGNLGNNYLYREKLDKAFEMYSESLRINKQLGRLKGIAYDYGNLGVILRKKGDLNGAEIMHRKALKFSEKIGELKGVAIHCGNIGSILLLKGDIEGAEKMCERALKIDEKVGHLEGIANQYENIGDIYNYKGKLDISEELFHRAIDINKKLDRFKKVAILYGKIGDIKINKGQKESAVEYYKISHKIASEKQYTQIIDLLNIKMNNLKL